MRKKGNDLKNIGNIFNFQELEWNFEMFRKRLKRFSSLFKKRMKNIQVEEFCIPKKSSYRHSKYSLSSQYSKITPSLSFRIFIELENFWRLMYHLRGKRFVLVSGQSENITFLVGYTWEIRKLFRTKIKPSWNFKFCSVFVSSQIPSGGGCHVPRLFSHNLFRKKLKPFWEYFLQ